MLVVRWPPAFATRENLHCSIHGEIPSCPALSEPIPGQAADRLIGAFIATLGLPPFNDFNEALKARLNTRFGQGDDYTYRIPGMIKVVQAAGRVIRSPEDEGVVILMDDRFAQAKVRALLPRWWGLDNHSSS